MTGQKPSVQLMNAMLHFHARVYCGRAHVTAWHGVAWPLKIQNPLKIPSHHLPHINYVEWLISLWCKIITLNLIREGFFLPLLCFTMLSYSLQQVCRCCFKIWCGMRSTLFCSHWWPIRIIVLKFNRCENEVMQTIGRSHTVEQNLVNESEATTRFCCRYCFWSSTVIRLFPFVTNLENRLRQLRLWRIICSSDWWQKRV